MCALFSVSPSIYRAHSVARNYQLRIGTNKTRITFDGFLKDDFERLQNLCKQVSSLPARLDAPLTMR